MTTNLADTTTNLNATAGGNVQTELTLTGTASGDTGVSLAIEVDHVGLVIHLEPLEAVELATNLLLYARADAWDGEVL
ncbi:hypothetical protein ACMT4L_16810 [Deinococcus sp. A31D244]|uniref:hypothetical protein n=1 Tax=Deinococcus sp. A31D244 TaxID=3397675 RepID=UPI0039E0B0FA